MNILEQLNEEEKRISEVLNGIKVLSGFYESLSGNITSRDLSLAVNAVSESKDKTINKLLHEIENIKQSHVDPKVIDDTRLKIDEQEREIIILKTDKPIVKISDDGYKKRIDELVIENKRISNLCDNYIAELTLLNHSSRAGHPIKQSEIKPKNNNLKDKPAYVGIKKCCVCKEKYLPTSNNQNTCFKCKALKPKEPTTSRIKKCIDCGKDFNPVNNAQKRCTDCAKSKRLADNKLIRERAALAKGKASVHEIDVIEISKGEELTLVDGHIRIEPVVETLRVVPNEKKIPVADITPNEYLDPKLNQDNGRGAKTKSVEPSCEICERERECSEKGSRCPADSTSYFLIKKKFVSH